MWISPSPSTRDAKGGADNIGATVNKTADTTGAGAGAGGENLPDWLLATLKQQGWQPPQQSGTGNQQAQATQPMTAPVVDAALPNTERNGGGGES